MRGGGRVGVVLSVRRLLGSRPKAEMIALAWADTSSPPPVRSPEEGGGGGGGEE